MILKKDYSISENSKLYQINYFKYKFLINNEFRHISQVSPLQKLIFKSFKKESS